VNSMRNPYIAGAPVVETSMFFGREDVFRWIEDSLTGKYVDHILVIHGQRRVGKTTVLKQIPNFLPKSYIQIFYDLQGRTNTTLDRFLWWMASEIVRTLNKETGLDLSRPERKAFTDPEVFLSEFLPEVQQQLDGHTLLLTFDEFDTLSRPDIQESLARPLINFLRRLFDTENLNFIFSIGSSGNKLENMQAAYTNFFKTALYRKVSFLTKAECVRLIQEPVKDVIAYDPEAVARISQVTSGHPYFTQLTCHELFARCQASGSRQVTRQDVEDILDDVIERGTVNLKFVWDEASDLEKWILAALAQEEGLSQKQIGERLHALGVRFSDADLNSAVLHLRDKDVLTQSNTFIIRLMKRWLARNRPMDRVREELVQTNPIADRFIEIGDELHDREQWEDALQSYQRALEYQENNLTALMKIAEIHLEQGRVSQAVRAFEKTLLVDSEHIAARHGYCQAMLTLGDQARVQGNVDEAIDSYKAILNLTPVHAEARQNLAEIFRDRAESQLSNGDDQAGLEALRQALEMTPEDEALKARYQQVVDQKKAALVQSWMDKAQRALNRKRWDEAARMADQALAVDPEDKDLQAKVAAVKDAPRQAKLAAYQGEAERAIEAQKFDQAIQALEAALLLAPNSADLQDWLARIQADQKQARLDHFNAQAEKAAATGDWDAAIAARQQALEMDPEDNDLRQALADTQAAQKQAKLDHFNAQAEEAAKAGDWVAALTAREKALAVDPENPVLLQTLEDTRTAQHQAQIDALLGSLQSAREAGQWEAAIQAVQQLISLEPEDNQWPNLLAELETAQQQAYLQDLLDRGQTAHQNKAWTDAIEAWEAYLEEEPQEREKFQDRLAHAQKYAQIQTDYQKAQGLIKSRRFDKAIPLLQGIIAQDPTYQSTSRLLVEAVEAREERQPIWRKPWIFGAGAAGITLILVGVLFGDQLIGLFSRSSNTTPEPLNVTEEVTDTTTAENEDQAPITAVDAETAALAETTTPEPTPTPVPVYPKVLAAIEDQPPTFEDDFSNEVLVWNVYTNNDLSSADNSLSQGGLFNEKLVLNDENTKYSTEILNAKDFVISADINYPYDSNDGYIGGLTFLLFANEDRSEYIALDMNYEGYQLQQKLADTYQEISSKDFVHSPFPIVNIQIISFNNTLTLIVRNNVVFSKEISDISGEQIYISGSNRLWVDNFKFWNLDGVDIAAAETSTPDTTKEIASAAEELDISEPFLSILNHIKTAPPSFQEYFDDTLNDSWEFQSFDGSTTTQLGNFVTDNQLRLPSIIGNASFYHPDMQNINDFAMVINLAPGLNLSDFTYVFRETGDNANEDNYTGYGIKIYHTDKQWELFAYEPDYSYELRALSPYQADEFYQIMIIAKGNSLGVFWEGDLIFTREDAQVRGSESLFNVLSTRRDGSDMLVIDHIEFWNLEGVDIAAAEIPSLEETSTTVQDYEQVLAAIEEEAPSIELQALGVNYDEWTFERSDLTGEDFVISTNINFSPRRNPEPGYFPVSGDFGGEIIFWLLTNNEKSEYLSITIFPKLYLLQQKDAGQIQLLDRHYPARENIKETISTKIIVFDDKLTLLIDNAVIFSEKIINPSGEKIIIFGEYESLSEIPTIDDFQFWNLEGVEIN